MLQLPAVLIYVEYVEEQSILTVYWLFYSTSLLDYLDTVVIITFISKIKC